MDSMKAFIQQKDEGVDHRASFKNTTWLCWWISIYFILFVCVLIQSKLHHVQRSFLKAASCGWNRTRRHVSHLFNTLLSRYLICFYLFIAGGCGLFCSGTVPIDGSIYFFCHWCLNQWLIKFSEAWRRSVGACYQHKNTQSAAHSGCASLQFAS